MSNGPHVFFFEISYYIFKCILVGRSHAKRKITKKSYVELREVLTDILVSVCKLNDDGKILKLMRDSSKSKTRLLVIRVILSDCRQDSLVETLGHFLPHYLRVYRWTCRAIFIRSKNLFLAIANLKLVMSLFCSCCWPQTITVHTHIRCARARDNNYEKLKFKFFLTYLLDQFWYYAEFRANDAENNNRKCRKQFKSNTIFKLKILLGSADASTTSRDILESPKITSIILKCPSMFSFVFLFRSYYIFNLLIELTQWSNDTII